MVRFKNRYLLIKIHFPSSSPNNNEQIRKRSQLNERLLAQEIRRMIQDLYGDIGSGLTAQSMQVKYLNSKTGLGIVRTSRRTYQMVWQCMTLMHGHVCDGLMIDRVQCVHLSGTIRNCQLQAIEHDYSELHRLIQDLSAQEEHEMNANIEDV